MRRLLIALLFLTGCDEWIETRFIAPPPPPGNGVTSYELTITAGAGAGVLFHHVDRSKSDGDGGDATLATSRSESIARVARSTRNARADDGYPVSGRVFVLWGLASGETDIDLYDDTRLVDTVHVRVLPQNP